MDAKLKSGALFAGRFRVGEEISVDRTGAFHRAVETASGRTVSLRSFAPQLKLVPHEIAALQARVAEMSDFRHPSAIVPTEVVVDGPVVATIAPPFEGRSVAALRQAARGGFLELAGFESVARSVADTMHAAHAAGIVHGGLRPGNIFVDPAGGASIADFGIGALVGAIVMRAGSSDARSEITTYISHAQGRGEGPYMTDDVFAFGAVVFEALTGDVPYPATKKYFLSRKQHPRARSKMSERRAERGIRGARIPMTWERLVFTCLDRDGFARPQRFGTVVRLLPPLARRPAVDPAAAVRAPASGDPEPLPQTGERSEAPPPAALEAEEPTGGETPSTAASAIAEPVAAAVVPALFDPAPDQPPAEPAPAAVPALVSEPTPAAIEFSEPEAVAPEIEGNVDEPAASVAMGETGETVVPAENVDRTAEEPAEQVARSIEFEGVHSEESPEPAASVPMATAGESLGDERIEDVRAPAYEPAVSAEAEEPAIVSEGLVEAASEDEQVTSPQATVSGDAPAEPIAASNEPGERASDKSVELAPVAVDKSGDVEITTAVPDVIGDLEAGSARDQSPEETPAEEKVEEAALSTNELPAMANAGAAPSPPDESETTKLENVRDGDAPEDRQPAGEVDRVPPPPRKKLRLKKPVKLAVRPAANGASSHGRKPEPALPPRPREDDHQEDTGPAVTVSPERRHRAPPDRFDTPDDGGRHDSAPGVEETRPSGDETGIEREVALTNSHQTAASGSAFAPSVRPKVRPEPAPSRVSRPRSATEELTDEFWGTDSLVQRGAPRGIQPRVTTPSGGGAAGRYGDPHDARGIRWSVVFLRTMVAVLVLGLIGTGVLYFAIEKERRAGGSELAEAVRALPSRASASFTRLTVAVLGEEPRLNAAENEESAAASAKARRVKELDATPSPSKESAPRAQTETPVAVAPQTGPAGSIAVRTVPFGAMVEIGGFDPQPGPAIIDGLAPGSYEVSVSAPGYATQVSRVEIDGTKRTSLDVVLERQMGSASIGSQPSGRAFEILDLATQSLVEAGTTPRIVTLPAGTYDVVFSTPEGEQVRKPVTVVTGGTVLVSADLDPPPPALVTGSGTEVAPSEESPPAPAPAGAISPPEPDGAPPQTPSIAADASVGTELERANDVVASQTGETSGEARGVPEENQSLQNAVASVAPPPADQDPGAAAPTNRSQSEDPAVATIAGDESVPSKAAAVAEESAPVAPVSGTRAQPDPSPPVAPAPDVAVASTAPPTVADSTAGRREVSREPPSDATADSVEPGPDSSAVGEPPVEEPRLYSLSEVDDKPLLLERRNPVVPRRFNRVNGEGRVQLTIIIDRDGKVSSARVDAATDDRLAEACLESVRFWKFSPPRKDSQQVAVRVAVPFVFR